jgi:hypothetical protein
MSDYIRRFPSRKRSAARLAWIAQIIVSDDTAEKIRAKHNLEPDDIIAAIQSPPARSGRLDPDGERLYIQVTMKKRPVLVVLYDAGDDVWHLASAYVIAGQQGA